MNGEQSENKAYRINFGYVDGYWFGCATCVNNNNLLKPQKNGTLRQKVQMASSAGNSTVLVEKSDYIIQIAPGSDSATVEGIYRKVRANTINFNTVTIVPKALTGEILDNAPIYLDEVFLATGKVSPNLKTGHHKLECGNLPGYAGKGKSVFNITVKAGATRVYTCRYEKADPDTKAPRTGTSVQSGKYDSPRDVSLNCADPGKNGAGCDFTYYTTNGKKPTAASNLYSSPITISETTLLKYFSVDNSGNVESVKTAIFNFGWAIPFTHTGIRAAYAINEKLSLLAMVANGCDRTVDNNDGKTIGFQAAVKPMKNISLFLNYTGGPEQGGNDQNWRNVLDGVLVVKPFTKWEFQLSGDYGSEDQGASQNTEWWGIAGVARYTLLDFLAFNARAEYFDDVTGTRLGVAQNLWEFTFTPEFTVHENMIFRVEYHHDQSSENFFLDHERNVKSQDTLSMNAIFHF